MLITGTILLAAVVFSIWSATYTYLTGGSPNDDRAEIEAFVHDDGARIVRITYRRQFVVDLSRRQRPREYNVTLEGPGGVMIRHRVEVGAGPTPRYM
jgi:hypothetical protein